MSIMRHLLILNNKHVNINYIKRGQKTICILSLILLYASCHSSTYVYKNVDLRELARAGLALGIDIEENDNWALMIESSHWIGVPYCYGGNDKSGIDCSGLNSAIYKKVYKKRLQRRSIDQYDINCKHIRKSKLVSGDLVFFAISDKINANNINHTGIYLKDDKFIHASSSRGVVVDNLDSNYFKKYWIAGGRVK